MLAGLLAGLLAGFDAFFGAVLARAGLAAFADFTDLAGLADLAGADFFFGAGFFFAGMMGRRLSDLGEMKANRGPTRPPQLAPVSRGNRCAERWSMRVR